jgi:transcriptional regulator with XRE-family HTH domain
MTLTPGQAKAARRLLGWTQEDLAGHVGVSAATMRLFESGKLYPSKLDLYLVRTTLESAGAEFIAIGGAPGVRLRKGA